MRQSFVVLMAVLAAALAPAILSTLYFVLADGTLAPKDEYEPRVLLVSFVFFLFLAFMHTLVLGLLATAWLLRTGRFRFGPMLLAGIVIGTVPVSVWLLPFERIWSEPGPWTQSIQTLWTSLTGDLLIIGFGGTLGVIGSTAFYLVYRGMSPDRSLGPLRTQSPGSGGPP